MMMMMMMMTLIQPKENTQKISLQGPWEVGFCLISSHSHATVVYTLSSLILPLRKKWKKNQAAVVAARLQTSGSYHRDFWTPFNTPIKTEFPLRKRIKISIKPLESNGEWPDSHRFPMDSTKTTESKNKETSKASVLYQSGSPKAKNFTLFDRNSFYWSSKLFLDFQGYCRILWLLLVIVCGATSYLSTTTR